ncbi:EamA family transporter [Calothrix sp. UHCC 0171]|uniref:EamA family transporter n=1 Tax=Calothrix sp. UHCC 0171 TaxID=3110245 RepID=UPI002B1EB566|nr:EamA family transporter [Calothrix sp. UHCC 0171]MEA5572226.1 EamA family transporter [Calothrix sp. UHCC 0171]
MNPQECAVLLVSVIASVMGQLFLKMGAAKLGKLDFAHPFNQITGIITTPELLIGLGCYGLGAIAYILLLTRVNLSVAGPSASLVYVFSVLIGFLIFKESIPLMRFMGLSFIVAGVILVVWNK